MKRNLIILTIFLMSGIWLFAQNGGGDVIIITSQKIKYDSIRTLTNQLDVVPKWHLDSVIEAIAIDTPTVINIANKVVTDSFPQMVEFPDTNLIIVTQYDLSLKQNTLTNPLTQANTTK